MSSYWKLTVVASLSSYGPSHIDHDSLEGHTFNSIRPVGIVPDELKKREDSKLVGVKGEGGVDV